MRKDHAEAFLTALIAREEMQSMWNVRNSGVPLFVHTIDVALLALDSFPHWMERHGPMSMMPTLVGALLHDLTKVTIRRARQMGSAALSHSDMMRLDPQGAVVVAAGVLQAVGGQTGIVLDAGERDMVSHIVAAHHGPWGSVRPRCPEAVLVHECDLYSARYHRQPPIDANDILPLLDRGYSRTAAARVLGVTPIIVRNRLAEACQAEWADSVEELLAVWRRRGRVVAGSEEAQARREEIRAVAALAERTPECLFDHRTYRTWLDGALP